MKPTEFQTSSLRIGFGTAPGSPFVDQRVRQAWMLAINRALYTDVQYDVSKFESNGVPVHTALESGLQANTLKGWFLNAATEPEKFGENAKYFKKDLAEAKKLLDAAGHTDRLETPLTWVQRSAAWAQGHWYNGVDIVVGMLQESGLFRIQQRILQNFYPDYIVPYHHQVPGANYVGAALSIANLPADPAVYLFQYYNSAGGLRQSTDSTLDRLTSSAIAEFDEKKRRELVHQIQVYEAGANFFPRMGAANGFSLNWPTARNWGVFQGGTGLNGFGGLNARNFLDPSKPPLKGA
jgi:ABC-type transport system substrate-binding protein